MRPYREFVDNGVTTLEQWAASSPSVSSSAPATASGRDVAEVRSAMALSEDQVSRLAASLKQATGKDVDVRVTVDPSVLGGVVTTIGDTVIDGSVRSRLAQVKSHIG